MAKSGMELAMGTALKVMGVQIDPDQITELFNKIQKFLPELAMFAETKLNGIENRLIVIEAMQQQLCEALAVALPTPDGMELRSSVDLMHQSAAHPPMIPTEVPNGR